jgi:hypothetical protein
VDGHPVNPCVPALRQGTLERSRDVIIRTSVEVQAGFGRADRLRGQLNPVQHQMRCQPQQGHVLAAG